MGFWNAVFPLPEPKPAPVKEQPIELLTRGVVVAWKYDVIGSAHGLDSGVQAEITVKMEADGREMKMPVSVEQFAEIQKRTTNDGIVKVAVVLLDPEFW